MASTYREGRQLTSVAWDHFEIKDRERGVATCNICHVALSYRTSVSNLMKHLKRKHGYYQVPKGDDDDDSDDEPAGDGKGGNDDEINKRIKTELWEYYETKDEDKQATCKICLDQLSYATTMAELFKHLKEKHSIDFDEADDEPEKDEDDLSLATLTEQQRSKKSSIAWDFFEIKDEKNKVAGCIQCGALCSYKSSVSNLMKHSRRKHGIQVEYQSTEDETAAATLIETNEESRDSILFSETATQPPRAHRSIVWLYFKCIDKEAKSAKCLICHKVLSHHSSITNLKKHLDRKHPNVKIPARDDGQKRILLSSGGELYEVETIAKCENEEVDDSNQPDTLEMDTVYLEDFDTLQEEKISSKTKISKTLPEKRKRKSSTSSEEEITFINRYVKKPSDSFDHFGKYIASLLRKLPAEASSRLQIDFLGQVMNVLNSNNVNSLDDK